MKYLIMLIAVVIIGCASKGKLHSVEVVYEGKTPATIQYAELICTDTSCRFSDWKPWSNNIKLHTGKWTFRAISNTKKVLAQTLPLAVPEHRKIILKEK